MYLEITFGWFKPFQNTSVIFQNNRKTSFRVGIKLLCMIKAFGKPAEQHRLYLVFQAIRDRRPKITNFLIGVYRKIAGPQRMKPFGNMCLIRGGGFHKVILHLGMDQINQGLLVILQNIEQVVFTGQICPQMRHHLPGQLIKQ